MKTMKTLLENSGLASLWSALTNGRNLSHILLLIPTALVIFLISPVLIRWLSGDPTAEVIGAIFYMMVVLPTAHVIAFVGSQMNDNHLAPKEHDKPWVKLLLYVLYFALCCWGAVTIL
jgi:uncharacterized membrane protein